MILFRNDNYKSSYFCSLALHSYAFDCVTHHLFHPYGTDSLLKESAEAIMREVTFDSSLQSETSASFPPLLTAS